MKEPLKIPISNKIQIAGLILACLGDISTREKMLHNMKNPAFDAGLLVDMDFRTSDTCHI